jgi:methyl-accepting chemotaxis protein
VTDEVRNLAYRASEAALRASEVIERSHAAVSQGTLLTNKMIESLGVIGAGAQQVDDVIHHIAAASAEQSQGISAVAQTITELGKMANQSVIHHDAVSLVQIQ